MTKEQVTQTRSGSILKRFVPMAEWLPNYDRAGLTQAYPVAGSVSRTALSDSAGTKTQSAESHKRG